MASGRNLGEIEVTKFWQNIDLQKKKKFIADEIGESAQTNNCKNYDLRKKKAKKSSVPHLMNTVSSHCW